MTISYKFFRKLWKSSYFWKFRNGGKEKTPIDKEIQNFIDDLDDSESFLGSITSSSDSGK